MEKLKGILDKIIEKFQSLSKITKIIITAMLGVIFISFLVLLFSNNNNTYKILFSDLDSEDAQAIISNLNEKEIKMRIEGNSILVPSNKVDELRLTLASEISFGSQGYELMDLTSSFGMSDEEFEIQKTRMIQGELERTIRSFAQIEDVRVHITTAKKSIFAEISEEGKAAIYLKIKSGKSLTNEQVFSIMSLVSGATDNIPKDNIEVIDQNMNLLSENLNNDSLEMASSDSVKQQQNLKKEFENELQKTVLNMLEPVFGKDKITVAINADLDFDSKQITQLIIDPNSVIVSQEITRDNYNNNENTSNSPVDNNMQNVIEEDDGDYYLTSHELTNYEIGKTENIIISAPGQVRRLTASVLIDSEIDYLTQVNIENIVASAIGYNEGRNDSISVLGIDFNGNISNETLPDDIFNSMNNNETIINFLLYGGIGFGIVALLIFLTIFFMKKKKNKDDNNESENIISTDLESKIDDSIFSKKGNISEEVAKYANENPEQVVDVIKRWVHEEDGGENNEQ